MNTKLMYTAYFCQPVQWSGPGLYYFSWPLMCWVKEDDINSLAWWLLHDKSGFYRSFTAGMITDTPAYTTPDYCTVNGAIQNRRYCPPFDYRGLEQGFTHFWKYYDQDGCCRLHGSGWQDHDRCECYAKWQVEVENLTPIPLAELNRIRHNWNSLGIAY